MTQARTFTYAQAAALALAEAMQADERVLALGEDLGRGGVFGQYRDPADPNGQPLAKRPFRRPPSSAQAWAWPWQACAPWWSCAWLISRCAPSTKW